MAIANVFHGGENKSRKWLLPLVLVIGAVLILWHVVPKVQEYFTPKQEEVIPAEVKAKTWHDLLPPPEKKAVVTDFGQPEFQTPVASVMPNQPKIRSKK